MNQHHYDYIFHHRFHTNGMEIDLFVQTVLVAYHGAYQLRPDKHDQDTRSGMYSKRIAEYIHYNAGCGTNQHIHARGQGDRHHKKA